MERGLTLARLADARGTVRAQAACTGRRPSARTQEATVHHSLQDMPPETEAGDIRIGAFEGGDVYARYLDLPPGTDFTPLFVGLPGDLCQCPHWGYVLEGSITVRYADGTEEISRAGDVYYWPGGHTGWSDEGVRFLEFNPSQDIRPVLDHVSAQLTG